MSGHHGPPDLDAQKDAQRPFTTDPHSPLGPLLPPPGGRHQERPHPGSPTPSPTPGHPPWAAPSCQLGRCPVASLKLRGEEPGQEVASGTHTHWARRARLHVPHGSTCPTAPRAPRPVLASGVRPGPRGSTAHDLLVSHGARRPRGPRGLGKAGGRRGIWWSWVPAVGGGHADPRPAQ